MKSEHWLEGLKRLAAALPSQDQSQELLAERGQVYRDRLDHLSEAQWAHAVNRALDEERWFPPIAALLQYAAEIPAPRSLAERSGMSEAELARNAEFRARREQRLLNGQTPTPEERPAGTVLTVEATDERRKALEIQRATILASKGTGTE